MYAGRDNFANEIDVRSGRLFIDMMIRKPNDLEGIGKKLDWIWSTAVILNWSEVQLYEKEIYADKMEDCAENEVCGSR